MFYLGSYLWGLATILTMVFLAWCISVVKRDVGVVDSLWSVLFLVAAVTYASTLETPGPRVSLVLILVSLWAVRLSAHITWRNWGQPEDRRYAEIRRRNEPGFTFKSLYLVFALQGMLAWLISLPFIAAFAGEASIGLLDYLGIALWLVGMVFEAGGDYQLVRFKAEPGNKGKVMASGLWRYTRHPNYFGDFCVWWGYFLIALSAGGWWSIFSPLLMSYLLLRVSGVALLEKDIGERRPKYGDYVARTNAFFPGPPRA